MSDATAKDVKKALHKRWSPPEFQAFEEVPTLGRGTQRLIDFLSVGMYRSDGHAVHACEVKVDRADWMDELETPGKHAFWEEHADYFWIAAPPGVVKEREVPDAWGYLKLHGSVMHRKVAAPKNPGPWDHKTRRLLVTLLKKKGNPSQARLRREYERGVRAGKEDANREHRQERFHVEREHDDAKALMKALRDEGIHVGRFNAESVVEQLAPFWRTLKKGDNMLQAVERQQERAQAVADQLAEALEEVDA